MAKALLICCFVALALAARVKFEEDKVLRVESGWKAVKIAGQNTYKHRVMFAVKNRNLDKLDELFWKVSDPAHAEYGDYLSLNELASLVAPAPESTRAVLDFLAEHGVKNVKTIATGDYITAYASPETLNRMLQTKIRSWKKGDKVAYASVTPYSLPEHVAPHVDFVAGVHHFPTEQSPILGSTDAAAPMIGPKEIRARYNVTVLGSGIAGNAMAVAEFQGQYYSPKALSEFFAQYVSNSKNDTVAKTVGANNPNAPGTEAALDIEYIMGVAPNIPTWFYVQPSMDFWSGMTAWVADINNDQAPPLVHSVSYGEQREHAQSSSYKDRLNSDFQKLGVRGLSIIFASGDSGSGCSLCIRFEPSFPATCPAVTSVGATRFLSGSSGAEGAVKAFGSGGGFSWYFDQPDYQKKHVEHYLTQESPPSGIHINKKGRATPDVAALGIGYAVITDPSQPAGSVGGTSASTPTFAAIISLLNDHQLKLGRPSLGFLNPWLYQLPSGQDSSAALWDVTEGHNADSCCSGFSCKPDWDPVTGLGTPNYPNMLAALPTKSARK